MADPWTIAQGRRQAEQAAVDAALVPTDMPTVYGAEDGPNVSTSTLTSLEVCMVIFLDAVEFQHYFEKTKDSKIWAKSIF